MRKFYFLVVVAVFGSVLGYGQQDVHSNSYAIDGKWGNSGNPWHYQTLGYDLGDPDNNNVTPNFVKIGHNFNRDMELNGRSYQVRELTFESGADLARTLEGWGVNALELRPKNGNCKIENKSSANHTFDCEIKLFAITEFKPQNGHLTFDDNILALNNFIDVSGSNGKSVFINGVISGTSGIGVQGNSILVLSAANTYTGETFINAGRIKLTNIDDSFGSLGDTINGTTVATNAVLELAYSGTNDYPYENLTLNGVGVDNSGSLVKTNTGTQKYLGNIFLESDARINVEKGTLDFRGDFDFNSGTVYFGGNGNFEFGSGSGIQDANKTTGNGAIYKDGKGALKLRDAAISGNILLVEGEIQQLTSNDTGVGLLRMYHNTTYRSNVGTDRNISKSLSIEGDVTFGYSGNGGALDFQSTIDLDGDNRTLKCLDNVVFSGQLTNGGLIISVLSTDTLTLFANNSFSGNTRILGGTLKLDDYNALNSSTLNISSGDAGSLIFGTLSTYRIGGLIGGGDLDMLGKTLEIGFNNTNTTFSGVLSNGSLTKVGTGTLTLTGENTYTENTKLQSGTLALGAANRIADGSNFVFDGGTFSTGGFNETVGTLEVVENSTINLGTENHSLNFLASNSVTWTSDKVLTITGWTGVAGSLSTAGRIFFGDDDNGLNDTQLGQIQFDGFTQGAEILSTGEIVPRYYTLVMFDNFNRSNSDDVGVPSYGGLTTPWAEIESVEGIGVEITDGVALFQSTKEKESESISYNMSDLYPVVFDESTEDMIWAWNMQSSYADPSGFVSTYYGSAFILGCNKPNYAAADARGYAVILGETGNDVHLRLVRFKNGLTGVGNIDYIASVKPSSYTKHFSVNVTYSSCSNTWDMIVREEASSEFTDPSRGAFTLSASGVDNVLTSTELPYLGALWKHNTSTTDYMKLDNIYIPALSPISDIVYTWTGLSGSPNDFNDAGNWSPVRDCARLRDRLIFNEDAVVENVPNQRIGQLIIQNNAEVTLKNQTTGVVSTLELTGGEGHDLIVDVGSVLNLDVIDDKTNNGIVLDMLAGTTGEVAGTFRFNNTLSGTSITPHRLLVANGSIVYIRSGGHVEALRLTGNPFGKTEGKDVVIFEDGSVYEHYDGGNPFGFSRPYSKVVFESGSLYRWLNTNTGASIIPSFAGRKYADFEYNVNHSKTISSGDGDGSNYSVDNMDIMNGTLIFTAPMNGHFKKDLTIHPNATLEFNQSVVSKIIFDGDQNQVISGSGNLSFKGNCVLEVNLNQSGDILLLGRNITLNNDLNVIRGEVQSQGANTLYMNGADHAIIVASEGSIVGTDVGDGNDLTLEAIGEITTISGNGSDCKFYNVTVAANKTLALTRGLEVKYGLFDVQNNAKLIINNGGFVASISPIYEESSQLIYNINNATYDRGLEWTSNAINGNPGYPGSVIIQNNTVLYSKNTTAELGIQNDLIIGRTEGETGTLDMIGDTKPIQVGRDLFLGEGTTIARLTLSDQEGGDLKIKGDFVKVADDLIGIFEQKQREVVMNGGSVQNISGVNNFDYLAIENTSGGVKLNNNVLINNRLRLGEGVLELNGKVLKMANESEIMRQVPSATMSAAPTVNTEESYDLRYTGVLTTGVEWLSGDDAIRDLKIEADITLQDNRTYNRDLYLDGSDLNLNGKVLTARGIAVKPNFSGKIEISQSGNRNIYGITGSRLDIIGIGEFDPVPYTKQVVKSDADSLVFGSDVEVRIGNGGVDFGVGNPTVVKGVLSVHKGGYAINNACNYAPASILRFANLFDYQVILGDLTWAAGDIASGDPGIPYNVEVQNNGTDLTLDSPRSLRNNLTIEDGGFTLTTASGTFDIGGNWKRTGTLSTFVHNDQEVIFNGGVPQTIDTETGEFFYRLSFDNTGEKTLNEDVTVLENLNIRGSGALNGNNKTITLHGNWNNEVGSSSFIEATSKVVFIGSGIQNVTSLNGETFHDLEMNNSGGGMQMNDPINISGNLSFIEGIIHTESKDFTFKDGSTTDGGNIIGYVNGKVTQVGTDGLEFKFPVGDYRIIGDSIVDVYQPAALNQSVSNPTSKFSVEYFHENYVPGTINPNNPPPTGPSVEAASTCNYWMIDREAGSASATVKLFYNEKSCITVEDASALTVVKWTGTDPMNGAWDNQAQTGYSSAPYTSGFVVSGIVSTFSPFTFGSTISQLNVLPIELLTFTASPKGQVVETHWVTSTEINNEYFTIERSYDAQNFTKVGRVEGAGNSTSKLSYSFIDDAPYSGISYYRLKQTDFDGATTYSDIRSVRMDTDSEFELINVYRSDHGVNLTYRSDVEILKVEVFDMLGKRLFTSAIHNINGVSTIRPSLVRGIYLLRLSNGVEVVSGKFFY